MVSVCLPSDALLQHLPSYLGFSYLGLGVFLHGCSSKSQLLLLTLDEGYLLTTDLPDLQRGIAPLGPPVPTQPQLLGRGVGPLCRRPWPWAWGHGVAPPGHRPWPRMRGNSSCRRPWLRMRGSSSRPCLMHRWQPPVTTYEILSKLGSLWDSVFHSCKVQLVTPSS